jgi:glycosidase
MPAVVIGVALFAAGPPLADASAKPAKVEVRRAKLRLASLRSLSASVQAGGSLRVGGRVVNLPRRLTETARLTFSLRARAGATTGRHLRGANVRRTRAGRSRSFSLKIVIPAKVPAGRYVLRVCVRRGSGELRGSCRAKSIRVTAAATTPRSTTPGGTPTTPGASAPSAALHSLRPPLTGENFYFVMADRFENGSMANDDGDPATLAPADPAQRNVHGFDATRKGYFHGGDLQGLLSKIDYIQGLGTTAIWLTPSFKNRAVQGPEGNQSAGYHGYWVTDFTQIDPHFGTNEDLRNLIEAAHARGIKVFFDIITNHTADVIAYRENQYGYVPKDSKPYKTAAGNVFDDRDFAGMSTFPALDPATSFAYTPYVPAGADHKTPEWLNDLTLYHNRGDTTFTGEDSQYGDFFGLDDLFTEHPRVVQGMIDIYDTWIRDMKIDGFRIDTMKHVNDEFWQAFSPQVLEYAKQQGKSDFFMFGEVADGTRPVTSHYTTHNNVQAVLDFPFMEAARAFASKSGATNGLRDLFRDDDYYTDADSNVYQLPTFLGNHDNGHVGMFLRDDNPPGTTEDELLARDKLAHALMYLSRGNPVVYFGDEQGFTGAGNDQAARQDMFASRDTEYDNLADDVDGRENDAGKNDNIGSNVTPAADNFDPTHPLYREIAALAKLTKDHPALRNGAQQHRYSESAAGIYAFSRIGASEQREYVVALNNAEVAKTASIPTYVASGRFDRLFGSGAAALTSDADKNLQVTVPALSAIVYESAGPIAPSGEAPAIAVAAPAHNAEGRDRMEVVADVGGDSFYEVTFYAKVGNGSFQAIGTDDNAPYRVFQDVSAIAPGTSVEYKAVVLDNAGHSRESAVRQARVAKPAITWEVPAEGGKVRDAATLRAVATPELNHYVATFQRRVGSGDWVNVGTDDSSPVYSVSDDIRTLPTGTALSYRAILDYGSGTVTSAERNVVVAPPPVTTAIVHYSRPGGDYADWGLHLFGDAIANGVATDWNAPRQRDGTDAYGAYFRIPLKDDTKELKFIVHRPGGDSVPSTREPGGDRSFIPAEHAEIWLKQGDATIYYNPPG